MPICKETITIAIPNPKNPQETAVRDKTIKFENLAVLSNQTH
jgi:hypothetical protein